MVNVSRILHKPEENKITVLGREILVYLDPQTGQRVDLWTNPWTNEQVMQLYLLHIFKIKIKDLFVK